MARDVDNHYQCRRLDIMFVQSRVYLDRERPMSNHYFKLCSQAHRLTRSEVSPVARDAVPMNWRSGQWPTSAEQWIMWHDYIPRMLLCVQKQCTHVSWLSVGESNPKGITSEPAQAYSVLKEYTPSQAISKLFNAHQFNEGGGEPWYFSTKMLTVINDRHKMQS